MPLICFASPKGGVGKTTLAANVAGELSRSGLRVVALDLDPQNCLRLHLGVPLQHASGFTHVLAERPDWRDYEIETSSGVSLLPHGSTTMGDAIALAVAIADDPTLLQRPIDDVVSSGEVCLVVDTPPGPSSLLAALLPRIDLLITVLLVDATSLSLIPPLEDGSCYASEQTDPAKAPAMGFILNQFDPRSRLGSTIADAASQHLQDRLLGIVYRDEYVAEAIAAQKLLSDYAPASKAGHDIRAISRTIQQRLAPASHLGRNVA